MKNQNHVGLDYDFLRYIGAEPETQKRIQGFYLPFFEGCKTVVDLGCGDGDFLELLEEKGIEATGVDWDEKCCAAARERGLNVICQDVFEYLEGVEEGSVYGVFCSHLVEHLPYERVIELLRLAHRALREGGKIVLSTPNVRGLFSHLEMFYLHFGHVSFYHPRLLCFFLEYVGFADAKMGENPNTASPLLRGIVPASEKTSRGQEGHWGSILPVSYELQLPLSRDTPLHRLIRSAKMFLIRLIVQPYLDRIVAAINNSLDQVGSRFAAINSSLSKVRELDRPFECYVAAVKR